MLKNRVGSIILASMILVSSTAFVFADETTTGNIQKLDTVETEMTSGWVQREGSHYYNEEDGAAKGWKKIDGKSYFFWSKTGKLAEGWTKINGKTYYITRENGRREGITKLPDGKTYNFSKDGVLTPGIVKKDGKTYCFDSKGVLVGKGKQYKSNASAYSGHSRTSTGQKPKFGTIAVDPKVIPYGSKVYIPYFNKVFVANDCGGAIKGTKIDIFMNSSKECYKFGRRNIDIVVLEQGK